MPASPTEYRRHAADCLELAERISDPTDKAHLITMAQSFLELAHKFELLEPSAK
jgi:hypothetical protein